MSIVRECRDERKFLIWVKEHSDRACERKRAAILLAATACMTQHRIAEVVGCNRTTVSRTYRRWREHGRWGLVDQRRFGDREKPAVKIRRLLKELCRNTPSDYGWSASQWSVELLREEVERQLECELSVAQTWRYLDEAGCRLKSPKPTVPEEPDDAEEQLAEMRQRLIRGRQSDEIVLFEDEMKIELNPSSGAVWCAPGHRKELVTPGRNRTAYVAATYNPDTEHMVWAMARSNDSDLLEVLLRMVADRYRRWPTIHLVMDNYSTHTSNQTDRVIEEFDGKLQRHFLPPYCPEANPIERVWWDVHEHVTRNHRHDSFDELLEEVYHYLRTRSYQGLDAAKLRRSAA